MLVKAAACCLSLQRLALISCISQHSHEESLIETAAYGNSVIFLNKKLVTKPCSAVDRLMHPGLTDTSEQFAESEPCHDRIWGYPFLEIQASPD